MLTRLSIVAVVALTVGMAFADNHEEMDKTSAEQPASEESVCFNRRTVDSFDALSDQYVFIKERGKNYYLLTMRHRCTGLRHARGIGIKDTVSRICSNTFAEIVYQDMGRLERCRIGVIERVESKDEAKALVAEREDYEKRMKKEKKKD